MGGGANLDGFAARENCQVREASERRVSEEGRDERARGLVGVESVLRSRDEEVMGLKVALQREESANRWLESEHGRLVDELGRMRVHLDEMQSARETGGGRRGGREQELEAQNIILVAERDANLQALG